jgi:hypothetical protein
MRTTDIVANVTQRYVQWIVLCIASADTDHCLVAAQYYRCKSGTMCIWILSDQFLDQKSKVKDTKNIKTCELTD